MPSTVSKRPRTSAIQYHAADLSPDLDPHLNAEGKPVWRCKTSIEGGKPPKGYKVMGATGAPAEHLRIQHHVDTS